MALFATQIVTTVYHVDANATDARSLASVMDDAIREYTERWGLVEITVSQPYTRSITGIIEDNAVHIAVREAQIEQARAEQEADWDAAN